MQLALRLITCSLALFVAWPLVADGQPRAPVQGIVLDGVTNQPIEGAIIIAGEDSARSGPDGRFTIRAKAQPVTLRVSADGYLDTEIPTAGRELEVRLFPRRFTETVDVVSTPQIEERPSSTPIAPEAVFRAPGSIDNVFRTLQTLPGVAATDDFGSRLAVRGGTPDQNLTMMDGVEIHNPYRLFGIASAFNPDTVENFQLTAGGFGAAYGDRLSSILIIENRRSRRDFQGTTAVSVTDANVVLEGATPLGQSGSWLLSARRTYYDLVAGPIANQDFPSFADIQLQTAWNIGRRHRFTVTGLRSLEDANLDFNDDDDGGRARLGSDITNNLISMRFDATFGEQTRSTTTASWYRNEETFDFDGLIRSNTQRSNAPAAGEAFEMTEIAFDRSVAIRDASLRQELDIEVSPRHTIGAGFEFHRLLSGVAFTISGDRNPNEANGSSIRGGAGLPDALDSTLFGTRGALWLQDTFTPSDRVSVEPGVRIDWSTINGGTTLSPRFAASYALTDNRRVRTAVGLYTQSPGYEKLSQSDYFIDLSNARTLRLQHEQAVHVVVGLEQQLDVGPTLRVEGYYKHFSNLLLGRLETDAERLARVARYDFPTSLSSNVPTAPLILSAPTNDAGGRAHGLDLYLQHMNPSSRLSGWISYGWGKATRESYGRRYAFEYDRRHALNVVGQLRLTNRWNFATTTRIASGFPHTPPIGLRVASTEHDSGRLVPATDSSGNLVYTVDYGGVDNLNSGRLPHYARADVRATYQRERWSIYFEVINALGRNNPITLEPRLTHDPASDLPRLSEVPAEGFPRIPTFGLRIAF